MIEVVVSLMLLAVIAVVLLPVLVNSLKVAATNASIATATQVLNLQMEDVRSRDSTCAAITHYAAETVAPVVDDRGVSLQATRVPVTCPSTYPGTVEVRVTVAVSGAASTLASAVTLVLVRTAT